MSSIPAVVVPAVARHTSTLIFLHGLGDTGHGWSSISENWRLRSKFSECAFVFPHAPSIPITVNMGTDMPGWFDLCSFSDISSQEDEAGILRSAKMVHTIIDEHIAKGVSSERIIVGGFSQGGAIALTAGLTCKHKLGGIAALSTWLPLRSKIAGLRTEQNENIPIFQAHGEVDYIVRYDWGKVSRDELSNKMGHDIEWHSYPDLDHSADPQEITALEQWLEKRIP